jgi:DNA-binding sugar fermentation-stimulating protein
VVYVPNTGSMLNLVPPQLVNPLCVLSVAPANNKRKYQHTIEMIQVNQTYVGIHSALANKMVANALRLDLIPECSGYSSMRQEVKVPEHEQQQTPPSTPLPSAVASSKTNCKQPSNAKKAVDSRIDFELLFGTSDQEHSSKKDRTSSCKKRKRPAGTKQDALTTDADIDIDDVDISQRMLVEVKSVTLAPCDGGQGQQPQQQVAEFPDSVSTRAKKHAECLTQHVRKGGRAALLFLIQRDDCSAGFALSSIDAAYKEAVREAAAAGVLVLPYMCRLRPREGTVELLGRVPFLE